MTYYHCRHCTVRPPRRLQRLGFRKPENRDRRKLDEISWENRNVSNVSDFTNAFQNVYVETV